MKYKDGKAPVWVGITQAKREKYVPEEQRNIRPCTGRPDVLKRGISQQLSYPNFTDEILDLRVIESAFRRGVPVDGELDPLLSADVGQDCRHQIAGGSTVLLSGSRPYIFARDRTLMSDEHWRMNGWGDDVGLEPGTVDIIADRWAEVLGSARKTKRGRRADYQSRSKAMAGKAECLADAATIIYSLVLVMNCGIFERDVTLADLPSFVTEPSSSSGAATELDPSMSRSELLKWRKHQVREHLDVDDAFDVGEGIDDTDAAASELVCSD